MTPSFSNGFYSTHFQDSFRDPRYFAIFLSSSISRRLRHCWISDSLNPQEIRSERVTQRKLDRSLSPRGRCNGTLYVEDASASGLGALFLCPLIIIVHLLLFFPRSSLLYPPAGLFFVSYFRSLCHTAVHRAHLTPQITATLSSRRPGRLP